MSVGYMVFISLRLYCRGKLLRAVEFFKVGRWWMLRRAAWMIVLYHLLFVKL